MRRARVVIILHFITCSVHASRMHVPLVVPTFSAHAERTNPRQLIYERADILVHPYCLREVTYERYCCVLNVTAGEFVFTSTIGKCHEDRIYSITSCVRSLNGTRVISGIQIHRLVSVLIKYRMILIYVQR